MITGAQDGVARLFTFDRKLNLNKRVILKIRYIINPLSSLFKNSKI
jgi:hypothetical protein